MDAEPIPHELLLRHAGFLRRLARDLVGDPAAADDAVQEVWLRALEKPPRESANLRAWLRVVLTNLVRSKARGDSRRGARERERALDTGAESSAPSRSDESLLRSVTEAVLALEEPLRTTVLQHYFQGSSAAVIAEREHLPVSTVKSRLQRALEILRVRMQRDGGDHWQASLLGLVVSSKVGKGVLLVSLKTKLAIGCAVLICAVLVYRSIDTPLPAEPTAIAETLPPAPAREASAVTPQPPSLHEEDKQDRVQAIPDSTLVQGEASIEPLDTSFYGSLRGPDGKLLTGLSRAGVSLTDSEGVQRTADAKPSGSFVLQGLPYGKYWVYAFADGFVRVLDTVTLASAEPRVRRDFAFKSCPILKIRVTTPEGASLLPEGGEPEQLKSAEESELELPKPAPLLIPVATIEPPGEWFTEVFYRLDSPLGIGRFSKSGIAGTTSPTECLGVLTVDHELPAYVSLVNYQRVLQTQQVRPGANEVIFTLSQEELATSMARVRLNVVDSETLAPLRAAVQLGTGLYAQVARMADSNGCAVFEGCNPGEVDLNVSAKGYEDFWRRVRVEPGAAANLGQIALDRALEVEVHLADDAGTPHPARLSIGTLDPSNRDGGPSRMRACTVDDAGVVRLAGLGRRLYVLRASGYDRMGFKTSEGPEFLPACTLLDLRSGRPAGDFKITLVPATRVMILLAGDPGAGLRLRITDEQGIELVSSSLYSYGPRRFALPQGTYRLALLDANQTLLKQQPLVVGPAPMTVELAR